MAKRILVRDTGIYKDVRTQYDPNDEDDSEAIGEHLAKIWKRRSTRFVLAGMEKETQGFVDAMQDDYHGKDREQKLGALATANVVLNEIRLVRLAMAENRIEDGVGAALQVGLNYEKFRIRKMHERNAQVGLKFIASGHRGGKSSVEVRREGRDSNEDDYTREIFAAVVKVKEHITRWEGQCSWRRACDEVGVRFPRGIDANGSDLYYRPGGIEKRLRRAKLIKSR